MPSNGCLQQGGKAGELPVPSECVALQSIPLPSLQDTLIANQIAVLCNAESVVIWHGMVAIIMEPNLIVPVCHTDNVLAALTL